MNVTSLYKNIPHDDGIAACRKIWEQRTDQEPPTESLVEMLTLVLINNNFTFDNRSPRIVFLVDFRQQIKTAWLGILWSKLLHGLIVSENTTLVTMDVTSLYTNIPHDDGIATCRKYGNNEQIKNLRQIV
jgi:hypothetical protein